MKPDPCKWCGSEDIKFSNKTTARGSQRHLAMYCNNCHCYGPRTILKLDKKTYYTSKERQTQGYEIALAKWNGGKINL